MVFAIATFGSKLLPFLLMRFYTEMLPPDQYSLQVNVTTVCNLILPLMYLSMGEAIIRYGLDKTVLKRDVFTTGILTVCFGYLVLLCCMPLIKGLPLVGEYYWLIYLYALSSAMHTVIAQFVRAGGFVRLFAISGIFTTLVTVLMNILLLVKFKMGAPGYVLSIIIADALSALILFLMLRLHRFVRIRGLDLHTSVMMLRYSVPLVPTALFWWVTNLSDRFFVTFMCGEMANGVYAVAYTLPNLITLVSMIFTQAWQISAFTEYKDPEGEKFFSNIFKSYYTIVFVAASGLIAVCRPVLNIITESRFHEAWRYTPFLVLAVAFSTLVTFLGTIYNAVQKNGMVMVTTFIGAIVNIGLNWLLIPAYGPQGAALATFISYFTVFLIRAVDSRRYIRIQMQPPRMAVTLAMLLAQVYISLIDPPYGMAWELLIFAVLTVFNFGHIWFLLQRIISLLPKRYTRYLFR